MPMDRRTLRNVLAFAKSLQALNPAKKKNGKANGQEPDDEDPSEPEEESNRKSRLPSLRRSRKKSDDAEDRPKSSKQRRSKDDKENEQNDEDDWTLVDRKKHKKKKSKRDDDAKANGTKPTKSTASEGTEEKRKHRTSGKGSKQNADVSEDGNSPKKQVREVNGEGAPVEEMPRTSAHGLSPPLSDRPAKRVSFSASALRGEESDDVAADDDARSLRRGRSPQRNSQSKERTGKDSSKDSDVLFVERRSSATTASTSDNASGKRGSGSRRRNSRNSVNAEPPQVGASVVVSIDLDRLASGVVRFVGTTQFAQGIWVGVELNQPVGKNDGSVKNVSYFQCSPMHGVFVRPAAAVPPDQEGLLAASLQKAQARRSNGSLSLPEAAKEKLAATVETSAAKAPTDERKDEKLMASVTNDFFPDAKTATNDFFPTIKEVEPSSHANVELAISSSLEVGKVAESSTADRKECVATVSSSSRLVAQKVELQEASEAADTDNESFPDGYTTPTFALSSLLSEDLLSGTPNTPDSFCSQGLSFEEKQVRTEVHVQLATAVEDRDLVSLRRLLPTGLFCGLSLDELDAAHQMLFSEVWWSTMQDVDEVRSSVSRLMDTVASVEELIADCPPQEEIPVERLLEQRVWERVEDRFEAAVEGAVKRTARSLECELAAVTRELRAAFLEPIPDEAAA